MTHTDVRVSHLNCRLKKTKLLRCGQTEKDAGKWPLWGVLPRRNWNCQNAVSSLDPLPPWPACSKDSSLMFCVKMKRTFLWHRRNKCIMLWVLCDTQWEGQRSTVAGEARMCGEWHALFPAPLLPHLFQHYIAQQRVDRANSYPPELEHLSKNI